jgi:hypothetical protein
VAECVGADSRRPRIRRSAREGLSRIPQLQHHESARVSMKTLLVAAREVFCGREPAQRSEARDGPPRARQKYEELAMTDRRSIAYDVTFTILYIGLSAAMVMVTLLLFVMLALDIPFGPLQAGTAVLNVLGWAVLPFAPRLYRRLVGHRFSWRENGVLGSAIEL